MDCSLRLRILYHNVTSGLHVISAATSQKVFRNTINASEDFQNLFACYRSAGVLFWNNGPV